MKLVIPYIALATALLSFAFGQAEQKAKLADATTLVSITRPPAAIANAAAFAPCRKVAKAMYHNAKALIYAAKVGQVSLPPIVGRWSFA